MRSRTPKRLLSIVLAIMMAVTSMPISAVTVFAANDEAVTEVEAAMAAYETKFSSDTYLVGISEAYEAYVACQEALDAYLYGGQTNALEGKADALIEATANLDTFDSDTYATATGEISWLQYTNSSYSAYETIDVSEGTANVLYAAEVGNHIAETATFNNCIVRYYMPSTSILLYDGITTPTIPVAFAARKTTSSARYIYVTYPTSGTSSTDLSAGMPSENPYFQIEENGKLSSEPYSTASYWYSDRIDHYDSTNWKEAHDGSYCVLGSKYDYVSESSYLPLYNSANNWDEAAAILYYQNVDFTGASLEVNLNWFARCYYNSDGTILEDTSNTIKLINYKSLISKVATYSTSTYYPSDISIYSQGGYSEMAAILGAATSFDPQSYFTDGTDDGYDDCVNDLQTILDNLDSMKSIVRTRDSAMDYGDLRDAISATAATYAAGNTNYTEDSWNTFVAAYESAHAIFENIETTGYSSDGATTAQTEAAALLEAFYALETLTDPVDTTELESVINTFEGYINIFTDESYSAVEAIIEEAKIAVWGAVDYYGASGSALTDSEEAQAIVASYTEQISEAITALRIDPDSYVTTSSGTRYSLSYAVSLIDTIEDTSVYYNYATFKTTVQSAQDYIATLDETDLTDYDTQYAEYVSYIESVIEAYEALEYGFMQIEDGTIATVGKSNTISLSSSDQGSQYIDFTYTGYAVVIRTSHESIEDYTYGQATIGFGTTIQTKRNNMLDSITLHATADEIDGDGGQNHISGTSNSSSGKPKALSDDQLETYAGCLDYNGFSITNLKYTGSENNSPAYILTLQDGTQITDEETALSTDLTDILGTTDGVAQFPSWGGMFARSTGSTAYAYATGDLNADIPATEAIAIEDLTSSDYPTYNQVSISKDSDGNVEYTYFGAVSSYHCQNTIDYAYYNWVTSKSTSTAISTYVNVVDASNLFDLINYCQTIVDDDSSVYKYTEDSYNNFIKYFQIATNQLSYAGSTASTITSNLKNRYTNLYKYWKALETNKFDVTFSYKNELGEDLTTVFEGISYGDDLSAYADEIAAITPSDYTQYGYTYTYAGWDTEVDTTAAVTADTTYTAVYTSTANPADWTAYNAAKNALLVLAAQDNIYTVDTLNALNESLALLSFYAYTEDEKAEATAPEYQDAIDTETTTLTELAASLTAADYDTSAADVVSAIVEDEDRYAADIEWNQTVTVLDGDDGLDVLGLVYATQAELDTALAEALSVMYYTIYLDGVAITAEDEVAYGTEVIVNSDGTYELNVDDTHVDYDGQSVAWTYSYAAPSSDYAQSTAKYMCSAPSFGFILKGDTYLTTASAEKTENAVVTFKANLAGNSTKTYGVCYANESGVVEAPSTPNYAYYTFTSYSCDGVYTANDDGTFTVDGSCTITANYAVKDTATYTINVWLNGGSSFQGWVINDPDDYGSDVSYVDETAEVKTQWEYNEKVTFITAEFWDDYYGEDFYLFLAEDVDDPTTWELLDADGTYQFYAYMDMDIVAVAEGELDTFFKEYPYYNTDVPYNPNVISNSSAVPIYASSGSLEKISLVGTFVLTDDYTLVESGYLFTTQTGSDLTVENVGTNGITRMKSSVHTVGNQFVINIKTANMASDAEFDFCAYAILKDSSGNQTIYYSPTYTDSLASY